MQKSRQFSDTLSETNLLLHVFLGGVCFIVVYDTFNLSDMALKISIVVTLVTVVLINNI
jgi:hypothetical protein